MPYYVIWCFDILLLELLRCEKKKNENLLFGRNENEKASNIGRSVC
jgi:hypothetical protein